MFSKVACLCCHEKWKLRYLVPALGDLLVILLQRQLRIKALAHDAASLRKLLARLANGAISNRVSATTNALVAPFAMSTACNKGLLALPHVGHTVDIEGGGSGVVGSGQERHDKKGGEE